MQKTGKLKVGRIVLRYIFLEKPKSESGIVLRHMFLEKAGTSQIIE
jgi:hypothetical protein